MNLPSRIIVAVWSCCLGSSAVIAGEPAGTSIGFSRDVLPLLTKMNCNTAKCHGALEGKGKLRLSPLGSDPMSDFYALAREAGGRRVSTIDPDASLMLRRLTSPQSTLKLKPHSRTYRILYDWMKQGAIGPNAEEPALVRLQVSPESVNLKKDRKTKIEVRATWSDGVTRDVTQWTTFLAERQNYVKADARGEISAIEPGFALVHARFLGKPLQLKFLFRLGTSRPNSVGYPTTLWMSRSHLYGA